MLKNFENVGTALSRNESKHIVGGTAAAINLAFALDTEEAGCGTGIDCSGCSDGDSCGSKGTCVCETHHGGTWCNTQL
jgi:hypothetical protein